MRQALACVRPQGGTAVIVGNAKHGQTLEIDPRELNQGKRLLGTWGGDNIPRPRLSRATRKLIAAGKLNVEPLLVEPTACSMSTQRSTIWNAGCVPGRCWTLSGIAKSVRP